MGRQRIKSAGKTRRGEGSNKLLDVYSRLDLPFFQQSNDDRRDSVAEAEAEAETIEFRIRPRFVFSHSTCLVCARTSVEGRPAGSPLTCDRCNMVSYCTIQHLAEDRTSHRALCNVLCEEFRGIEGYRFPEDITPDVYRSLRVKMMRLAEDKLRRPLELWEREIILYPPRVCRNCRTMDQRLVSPCANCTMEYHCQRHAPEHAAWCRDYRVFRRILSLQHEHGCVDENFGHARMRKPAARPRTGGRATLLMPGGNFDEALLDAFGDGDRYRRIDAYTYAVISLSATSPLTALFALEKTNEANRCWADRETLRIDVVGAEFHFECSTLRAWEIFFLHYLPKLKRLELVFTGAELRLPEGAPIELLSRVPLCGGCRSEKRRIVVGYNENKLYHETDEAPVDLVCLFNPGLYRATGYAGRDTWPATIRRFCRAGVPVVVTSYTEAEIPMDIERIRSTSNIRVILEGQRNPFASVKPDRNFVSDDVAPLVYKNYCVSVIEGLC